MMSDGNIASAAKLPLKLHDAMMLRLELD